MKTRLISLILVIVLLVVSLLVGAVDIPAETVADILLGKDSGKPSCLDWLCSFH